MHQLPPHDLQDTEQRLSALFDMQTSGQYHHPKSRKLKKQAFNRMFVKGRSFFDDEQKISTEK